MSNSGLLKAKFNKNDEFYTRYDDIGNEVNSHIKYFEGKVVYCNCDNPSYSNFWKFFYNNFSALKLEKLIASYISYDDNPSFIYEYDGIDIIKHTIVNGSYDSVELNMCYDMADIVVSNPPFSLIGDYIKFLFDSAKKFLLIAPLTGLIYRKIFSYTKSGQIFIDNNCKIDKFLDIEGNIKKFGNVCWATNDNLLCNRLIITLNTMEYNLKSNRRLVNRLQKSYGVCYYPKYMNYNAIEVPFVEAIPSDYNDVMGVPISFLKYIDYREFEIIGFNEYCVQCNDIDIRPIGKDFVNLYFSHGNRGHYSAGMRILAVNQNNHPSIVFSRLLVKRK